MNEFTLEGVVQTAPVTKPAGSGNVTTFVLQTGSYGRQPMEHQVETWNRPIDDLSVGQKVRVTGWVRSRSWQKSPSDPVKYFASLRLNDYTVVFDEPANEQPPRESDELPF